MDRGEGQKDNLPSLQGLEGIAAGASARVGEILTEAERLAQEVHAEADRAVAATRRSAEQEAERIAEEAREAARAAARERAQELAALQAALTARGPAVVEGLEGAGVTRARLEAVTEALAAAAGEVTDAAEEGDPRAGGSDPAAAAPAQAPPGERAEEEASPEGADAASPGAEDAASPEGADAAPEEEAPEAADPDAEASEAEDAAPEAKAPAGAGDGGPPAGDGGPPAEPGLNGDGNGAAPYDGTLPAGAPLARKPKRSRERDARFAALLLAVQGRPRDEVEAHLRSEYGFDDVEPILDEVFGRATA